MVKNSLLASGIGKDVTVTHFCKSVILIVYLTNVIFYIQNSQPFYEVVFNILEF